MVDPNVSNLSSVFDDEDGKEEDEAKKTEVNGNKRKASNLVHGLAINFKDSASDFEEEEGDKPIVKKAKTVTNKETYKPKAKKGKTGKIDGATEEQHRRAMGDQIKSKLRVLGGQVIIHMISNDGHFPYLIVRVTMGSLPTVTPP